jgi:hypothetical protein
VVIAFMVLVMLWLIPKVWRMVKVIVGRVTGWFDGSRGTPQR